MRNDESQHDRDAYQLLLHSFHDCAYAEDDAAVVERAIDEIIRGLPEKPRSRCDREGILRVLTQHELCSSADRLRAFLEDSMSECGCQSERQALKEALQPVAPLILWAKLAPAVYAWKRPPPPPAATPLPAGAEPLSSEPLPENAQVSARMRAMTRVANSTFAFAPRGEETRASARLIRGAEPPRAAVLSMSALYSRELSVYPRALLRTIGVETIIFCRNLSYDGQARRDVPDLLRHTLFIDATDAHGRRSRHAFHHELWHAMDYRLHGPSFESRADAEWEAHNPMGFAYGDGAGRIGGVHMREAGVAELSSAPNLHFLNRQAPRPTRAANVRARPHVGMRHGHETKGMRHRHTAWAWAWRTCTCTWTWTCACAYAHVHVRMYALCMSCACFGWQHRSPPGSPLPSPDAPLPSRLEMRSQVCHLLPGRGQGGGVGRHDVLRSRPPLGASAREGGSPSRAGCTTLPTARSAVVGLGALASARGGEGVGAKLLAERAAAPPPSALLA